MSFTRVIAFSFIPRVPFKNRRHVILSIIVFRMYYSKITDTPFYPLLHFTCTFKIIDTPFSLFLYFACTLKSINTLFRLSRVLSNSLTRYFASRIYPQKHHHAISLLACTLQFANSLFRLSHIPSKSPTLHFPSLIPHVISCFQFSTCFMISRYIRRRGMIPSLQSPCVTTGYAVLQPLRLIRHAHTAREHPFPPHSQSKRHSTSFTVQTLFHLIHGPNAIPSHSRSKRYSVPFTTQMLSPPRPGSARLTCSRPSKSR